MNNGVGEMPLYERVGFDYVATVRALLQKLTYMELAGRIGYESVGSVGAVLKGHTPSHRHGEALWALHIEMYGCKPPLVRKIDCSTAPMSA